MFEECLYFNSNALARTVSRIWEDAYRQFDLSPPHAFLLRLILARPGLLPREIAEELQLSRSTVSRFLDSLEQRGLLIRRPAATDGRELQVYPSKKAQAIHKALDDTGKQLSKQVADIIGVDQIQKTVAGLREIQKQLGSN